MGRNSIDSNGRLETLKRLHRVLARIQTATVLVIFIVDKGAHSIWGINQWEGVALDSTGDNVFNVNIPGLAAFRSERVRIIDENVGKKGISDLEFVEKRAFARVGAAAFLRRGSFGNAPARLTVTGFFSGFRTERTLGRPRCSKVGQTHVMVSWRLETGLLSLPGL
jgi:DNA-binding beta-propeller fold protein YncE